LRPAQGFFYNRYTPDGNATGQATGANKNQQLWYHLVGAPQSADVFVLALPDQPDWSLGAGVTDDQQCARRRCMCNVGFGLGRASSHACMAKRDMGCRERAGSPFKQALPMSTPPCSSQRGGCREGRARASARLS
jgi:hypothetical protein